MLLLNTTICMVRARLGRSRAREDIVAGFYFLFQNVSTAFGDTASCIAGPGGSADCPTPSGGP